MKINKALFVIKDVFKVSKNIGVNHKKIKIIFSIVLINLATFLDIIAIVTFTSFFEDSIEYNPIFNFFIEKPLLLPIYVFLRFAFVYIEKLNINNLQLDIEKSLRTKIMSEVFDKGNYTNSDSYFYITQLSAHVAYFYAAITSTINVLIQSIAYLAYLLLSNSSTLSYFLLGIVILFPITKNLAKKSRSYVDKLFNETQMLYKDIQKLIDNLFLIKILKQTEIEMSKYKKKLVNYKNFNFSSFKFTTLNYLIPNFVTLMALSLLLNFSQSIKFLTLEFIGIILRLFQSLGELNKNITMVMNSHVHLEKYFYLVKNIQEIPGQNYVIETKNEENNSIIFKNVKFKYLNTEEYIFENINFKIKKGQKVLLTGPNGSGKSTILGLTAGIYFSEKGLVTVSSKNIGYVGISSKILESSLFSNICFSISENIIRKPDFKREVLGLIHEFKLFDNFNEDDLDLEISEKNLSTGQKQKIGFIRTLLKKPDIILLDEATANLDSESLELILQKLKDKKVTIINSTHLKDEIDYDLNIDLSFKNGKRIINVKIL